MRSVLGPLAVLLAASCPAVAFQLPPAHDDAPLRAVRFLDPNHGVAVGDHGTVWMTLDGGKTWDRMKTGTRASLRGVWFVNPLQGWAVGRTELAGRAGSVGVVLATEDGGLTWAEANGTPLPGLNAVTFFDEKQGVAVGDGCDAGPSGVFVTGDGGRTWVAVAGPRATSWTCGHFTNLSTGVLGGVWSKLSVYRRGEQTPADLDPLGGRAVRGLAFDGPSGVAACDGGVLLSTRTGGGKWAVADLGLPAEAAACLDFRCVCRVGRTVWAAGRPGSVVLKSADGGVTWTRCKTGWDVPLHGITAVSETEAWAVGDLGAILKTTDGGETWAVQRCGGRRAAVLFAHAGVGTLPADAVSVVGGRDGYFAAGLCLTGVDPATADLNRCLDEFRVSAAVRATGGAAGECGWMFPVPTHLGDRTPDELLAAWDKKLDGKAEDRLVRQLVLAMRMWSPEVVVSDLLAATAGPAERLALAAAQKAFTMADDPAACPEQIEVLGLKPTAPKKLYAVVAGPTDAAVKYDHTAFDKFLANTAQGHAEPALAVLGDGRTPPATRCFKLVSHRFKGSETHADLTQGLALAEGGTARRKRPDFHESMGQVFQELQAQTATRRTLETVILAAGTPTEAEKAMGLATAKLHQLPADMACRTAVGLGRQLAADGKWVAAREMFLIAAAKYGTFPEAAEAVRWLTRYYASGEARRRANAENAVVMRYAGFVPAGDGVKTASHLEPAVGGQTHRFGDAESAHLWAKACLEMDGKLKAFGPAYTRDPAVLLSLLSARRQLGLTADAAAALTGYFESTPGAAAMAPGSDPWRDCLAAERWLLDRATVPAQPKPFALCAKVADKPYLDGKLGDACWDRLKPVELKAAAGDTAGYETKAYFVHDDEYLYFAVNCTHPDGRGLPKATARRRDDDLRGKDRVDIVLDLDRDYQTYFRLQVDQRGCVADDCWGDAGWNPKWFVAVEPTPTGWTAEIAVPRSELTGGAFKGGATWGMNVTRVVPGVGCQSWSGPADAAPRPERMGLMQFHTEVKR